MFVRVPCVARATGGRRCTWDPEIAHSQLLAGTCLSATLAWPAAPKSDETSRRLAHDVFKELIEINTTDSVGSTTDAANAMARRFRDAGFADADLTIAGPNARKVNLVVRLHGRTHSKLKPLLIIAHTDVVEAQAARTGPPIRSSSWRRTATSTGAARRT